MATRFQTACCLLAGILLFSLPSAAQLTAGDVSMTANGAVNVGYNDNYGTDIESSHGLGFGGVAALNGFFYNPNFLSFNINPYYNQSRSNSGTGSISDASGVTLNSGIFGGSHFPGSVNYSAAFNSTGNYGIPGISSLNTNGNSQNFGINWGAYVPGLPSLSIGYQMGSSNYTLYGADEGGNSKYNSFNLSSSYTLFGFGLNGGISHGNSDSLIPGVILGGQSATANSDSTSYTLAVSHPLPWHGSFNTSFSRNDLNSDYLGYTFNGDIDTVNTVVAMQPTPKLSLSLAGNYTDNLSGSLYEALVPGASGSSLASAGSSGAVLNQASNPAGTGVVGVQSTSSEQSSHGLNLIANTTYAFAENLQANGFIERRQQSFLGENYGSNLYDAGVFYTRQIAGGYLGSSLSVFDSTVDGSSQNQLGFSVTTNYGRRIGLWQVSGYFNYAQNVQTLLVTYDTSAYSFSGTVSRKIGRWYWTAAGGAGRSGLTAQPGTRNSSESFSTTFGMKKLNFGGTYAKSDGNSLAGGYGLVTTPLPPVIPSNLLVLYGGTSYGASVSAVPLRRLNVSASYAKSQNDLTNVGVTSWNNYKQENAYFQYQFRQLGINGGYTHLVQGFSASGSPPASFSSVYIGIYRWFNFF